MSSPAGVRCEWGEWEVVTGETGNGELDVFGIIMAASGERDPGPWVQYLYNRKMETHPLLAHTWGLWAHSLAILSEHVTVQGFSPSSTAAYLKPKKGVLRCFHSPIAQAREEGPFGNRGIWKRGPGRPRNRGGTD